jgi:hypothetical protein
MYSLTPNKGLKLPMSVNKLLRKRKELIGGFGPLACSSSVGLHGEIEESDDTFMTKLSLVYSVKYEVISSFTELIARGLNPLQPLSALRNGAPLCEAQLAIDKLPLQSHTEPPRHAV